jgi:hypothetical protein
MTYIQKKRIKLMALAAGVIIIYIYLLGVMTAHAAWVKINDVEYSSVYAFYYDNAIMDINNSTGLVKTNLMFHFTPTGAQQFVIANKLDSKLHVDLTYIVTVFEANYKTNKWRVLNTTSYNSKKQLTASDSINPATPWDDIFPGSIAEKWMNQIRKDYKL